MDVNGAVERLFAPARRPGSVGAEAELIPVTDTARPRAVDPAVLAAGFDAGFVRAAAPSFEPGGQLELSPAPRPTAAALVRDLNWMLRRAAAIAAGRGGPRGGHAGRTYRDRADRRPARDGVRGAASRPARPGGRVRGVRGGAPPIPHPGGGVPVVSPVAVVPAGPAARRLSRGALPR